MCKGGISLTLLRVISYAVIIPATNKTLDPEGPEVNVASAFLMRTAETMAQAILQ